MFEETNERKTFPIGSVFNTTENDPVSPSSPVIVSIGVTVTQAISSSIIVYV